MGYTYSASDLERAALNRSYIIEYGNLAMVDLASEKELTYLLPEEWYLLAQTAMSTLGVE